METLAFVVTKNLTSIENHKRNIELTTSAMCLNSQTFKIETRNQPVSAGEGVNTSSEINKEKLIDILDQVIALVEEDDVFQ